MALRDANPSKKFIKLADHKADDLLVMGTYLGFELGTGKFASTKTHFFKSEEGMRVGICGRHLNYIIDNEICEGDFCHVTYLGKQSFERNGERDEAHQFKVQIDDEKFAGVTKNSAAPIQETVMEPNTKASKEIDPSKLD